MVGRQELALLSDIYAVCRSRIKGTILDTFAGPPSTGAYSPSVQVSTGL